MKNILSFMLLLFCFFDVANAGMYDPFYKTAKRKPPVIMLNPSMFLPLKNQMSSSATLVVPPTVVSAIMNNKAFINGRWYRVGEHFNGSKITTIQNRFVALRDGNLLKMIPLGTQKHLLSIKEIK